MVAIRVVATLQGINQYTKKLSEEELFRMAYQSMSETMEYVKYLVSRRTPIDRGIAANTLVVQLDGSTIENLNGILFSPTDYFHILEFGRRPGAKMPPTEPIAAWAERHGFVGKSAVYLLRRAIARRGLPAHHIMRNALREAPQHFKTVFLRLWLDEYTD